MIEQILSEIPKQKTFTDKDKPLLETTIIFAHNAYNSNAYGAYFPNQGMSITEVLDLGINGVELDVYFDNGELRLCHLLCADYGIGTSLKMSDALNEIAQWIAKHPQEVVFIKIEDHLNEESKKLLSQMIRGIFDSEKIFTNQDLQSSFDGVWPSLNTINDYGKQLVIMPQSDMKDDLMFDGSWGGPFKQSFISGSIAKAKDLLFKFDRTSDSQLIEVGEDQAPLGILGNVPQKIPIVQDIIRPFAAGDITESDIQILRQSGANIISLDHIKINDIRLKVDIETTDQKLDFGFSKPSSSTISDEMRFDKLDLKSENLLNDMVSSVQELRNNAYVMIPTSLIAGYYVDRITDKNTNENKSLKNQALQKMIPAIMSSILPLEGKLIFNATKNGKAAYDKYVNQVLEHADELTPLERASALAFAIPPALGGMTDTVARVVSPQYSIDALGYSYVRDSAIELIGENYASFAINAINMGIKFIANGLMIQPAVKAIKAGLNGEDESSKNKTFIDRVGEGLTRGVEQSFFGKLFKADSLINQTNALELAALRWQKVLNQKPELVSDIDAQRKLYDKMVQKGNERAIKSGVLERDILPYPSFDSVKLYLENEKDRNFIDETLPLYVSSKNPSSFKGK